ncbi:PAS domain-containing sensor histidine kinase [Aneurinibacillus danicus]|uniref:Sensor histidine kinase n=1 Tax=Aneurinibacillus danicus TaxID=267746 RepID=A0A511V2J5_9BACL|nr:PAS domain-containing sensor histidine kinase [Aneurinibacillus danicus]GEN33136.1 hypothetical protein ADA01nite_05960 [Aneurinibacillus danicus]
MQQSYLRQIYEHIQDGIIIMDHERIILEMNPSSQRMTGWRIGDKVPYCSYCQTRQLAPSENRCYLISREEVPYFLSEMPTYQGETLDVEMSTALIYQDEESERRHYLLVLRDQRLKKKEEEARISKLIIQKLIEAQESEHKRLAQELHDGVGQSLYSISVALQAIEMHVKDQKLHNYIEEVRRELEKAMHDVKSYSHQLRPQSLDQLGLVPTVRALLESLKRNLPGINFMFETNVERRFLSVVEINLYRVIQEALHNILKYANASSVTVCLEEGHGELRLFIHDNGSGFDIGQVEEGLGLKHMEERIHQISGTFSLYSKPKQGTIIRVSVPVPEVESDDQGHGS